MTCERKDCRWYTALRCKLEVPCLRNGQYGYFVEKKPKVGEIRPARNVQEEITHF